MFYFMFLVGLCIGYFAIRAVWVKKFSMVILQRSPPMFVSLPSFRYMLFERFWVWEEIKFLPNIEDLRYE